MEVGIVKPDKTQEYAMAVADAIASLFRDNEEGNQQYRYNLDTMDATAFFTGAIQGLNYMFNKFTGEQKNSLEFTHLCNRLIVQDLLKDKK
jgi:hypothetical protein